MQIAKSGRFIAAALLAGLFAASQPARAAAPDPAKWEKDIAAFEVMDRTNPPPKGAVLFVGSSTIRFWTNLASDFPDLKTVRRGFGGAFVPDVTYFADRIIIPYKPSKIVVYAGDNDIGGGRSPEQVYNDFRALVKKVRAGLPKAKIYFLAIKPSPSRWHLSPQSTEANRLIRRYCRTHRNTEFIDIWTPVLADDGRPNPALFEKDNLHVNKQGYARWTKIIQEALKD